MCHEIDWFIVIQKWYGEQNPQSSFEMSPRVFIHFDEPHRDYKTSHRHFSIHIG